MKRLLISAALILNVLFGFPQEMQNIEDLAKVCSESPDNSITTKYPNFSKTVKNMLATDKYLLKVYFGRFDGKKIIYYTSLKGYIVIDQVTLENKPTAFDNISTWNFFSALGSIHSNKDNPDETPYESSLNRYSFALNNAIDLYKKDSYCGCLQLGISYIKSAAEKSEIENIKQAAIDIQNQSIYTVAIEITQKCAPSFGNMIKQRAAIANANANNVSKNQQQPTTFRDQSNVKQSDAALVASKMENIRIVKDEFSSNKFYYSEKTPKYLADDNRLYLYIVEDPSGEKALHINIRHNADLGVRDFMVIEKFVIKTDTQNYPFDDISRFVSGNGTAHSCFNALFKRGIPMYNIMKELSNSDESKVRLIGNGRQLDFTVSSREKKAIKDVMELYEAMTSN